MQTIQLKVDEGSVGVVMTLLDNLKNNMVKEVKIINDTSLSIDPFMDARKKELQQVRDDIKNGDMELLSEAQYEDEIKDFFETLEK